ncbi:MAG TPA: cyclohexanecarboxylate-CoA ligase [Porticoccaceae bacterium]|nr:cyclohexanecarboxylate-CoA ligase [Porticoccaceae bacterium]HCO60763.1 cyclohexanecarboxylate-CoA ligase [Porticoccaceae bacterium]
MIVDPILPQERIESMRAEGWWRDENLLGYFDAALAAQPNDVAVVDYRTETGEKISVTYAELNERANKIAVALAHYGIEKQDVVSFQLPNWWEFVAVNLACLRIGAVSNPLMPIFRERELSFMVDFAESKVLIVPKTFRGFDHEEMIDNMRDQLPHLEHLFTVGGSGDTSFEDKLLNHSLDTDADQLFRERQLDPLDVVLLMYTSGTTGMPKGVMHCANTFVYNVHEMVARCQLTQDDDIFMGSPLAHLTGFMYGMWMPMMLKAKMILLDVWNVNMGWQLISEENASFAMGATPFLADLTASDRADDCNSTRFRLFVCGGAPIPRVLAETAAEKLSIHLMAVWGMSECGVVTTTKLDDPKEKVFGTDGVAVPGCTVKIVDPESREELPRGTEGLLLERGPATFIGYLKRPEAYDVDEEGFFDTGDLATMDEDGYIRITGRSKDIIIRGGENIPVVEVENILYRHPDVIDCAVVAMPDERLGELGCCFVTLQEGATMGFQDMIQFLKDNKLAKNYLPEHLEVVNDMPRTASGKIQKFQLREAAKSIRKS